MISEFWGMTAFRGAGQYFWCESYRHAIQSRHLTKRDPPLFPALLCAVRLYQVTVEGYGSQTAAGMSNVFEVRVL
jgi:hypothetical protein